MFLSFKLAVVVSTFLSLYHKHCIGIVLGFNCIGLRMLKVQNWSCTAMMSPTMAVDVCVVIPLVAINSSQ